MLDGLLWSLRKSQCPPYKALQLSAVDHLRLPSGVAIVVKKIPIIDKIPEFINVYLSQDLLRGSYPLRTSAAERAKKVPGREVFWICHAEKSFKAGTNSRRHLALILLTSG
jgi:hypothetical protein